MTIFKMFRSMRVYGLKFLKLFRIVIQFIWDYRQFPMKLTILLKKFFLPRIQVLLELYELFYRQQF